MFNDLPPETINSIVEDKKNTVEIIKDYMYMDKKDKIIENDDWIFGDEKK